MNSDRLLNADLYLKWVTSHGLNNDSFAQALRKSIETYRNKGQTATYLITTRDKGLVFNELEALASSTSWSLFHFSLLRRLRFDPACKQWDIVGAETSSPADLLEQVKLLEKECLVVVDDLVPFLRDRLESRTTREMLAQTALRQGQKPILLLVELPEVVAAMPSYFRDSLEGIDVRLVDIPDSRGFFRRGKQYCLLPYLRAYLKAGKRGTHPSDAESKTRSAIGGRWNLVVESSKGNSSARFEKRLSKQDRSVIGWTRFLRADQTLDCIKNTLPSDVTKEKLAIAINRALEPWVVSLSCDDPLLKRSEILDRRVETIRIAKRRGELWSTDRTKPPRNAQNFPDELRRPLEGSGIDPVHTPENERTGLTRYLAEGWQIGDDGALVNQGNGSLFGPSTSLIPHRFHDEPRRLMLGASLQSRAVDIEDSLANPLKPPRDSVEDARWYPPGRDLRVAFSTCHGWTHEDAIVLSKSAARQLRKGWEERRWRILIPTIVSRVEIQIASDTRVEQGTQLIRAFIDLFALGFRSHEVEEIVKHWNQEFQDGWLEIGLPKASAPIPGHILDIERESILELPNSGAEYLGLLYEELIDRPRGRNQILKYREAINFIVQVNPDVSVGDKLSTRHGIKGVVSRIIDDNHGALPIVDGDKRAEIVLSPIGIARRSAMGQFREASSSSDVELPRNGTIFVMRQPQDAIDRCRARGVHNNEVRGQRYGEMEFWALMAHGASAIAGELLSPARSTANWMHWEAKVEDGDHRKLATRALNRYLSVIGIRIEGAHLIESADAEAYSIVSGNYGELKDAWDLLNDSTKFASIRGGRACITFEEAIPINFEGQKHLIKRLYVLPPWLRPDGASITHSLTKAYRELLNALAFGKPYKKEVERCVEMTFHQQIGVHAFLRREVLGRRLTRSARAVIIPRPDLRIDQIMIPEHVAEILFDGLPVQNRRIVLVNRNPTLHRLGLLALRPVINKDNDNVFGLPLGLLMVLGADFDGDQVNIVALETEEALKDAERLLPGAGSLRRDLFRPNVPAFPLLQELSDLESEKLLSAKSEEDYSQESWALAHQTLLEAKIKSLEAWPTQLMGKYVQDNRDFRMGLDQDDWLRIAAERMDYVYAGVRKKGRYGGVLRREFYRQEFKDESGFWWAVAALQAITERLTQSVLTTKTGEGASVFDAKRYFENPKSDETKKSLKLLEPKGSALDPRVLADALGERCDPEGLLGWIANPTTETLLRGLNTLSDSANTSDPRLAWFFKC